MLPFQVNLREFTSIYSCRRFECGFATQRDVALYARATRHLRARRARARAGARGRAGGEAWDDSIRWTSTARRATTWRHRSWRGVWVSNLCADRDRRSTRSALPQLTEGRSAGGADVYSRGTLNTVYWNTRYLGCPCILYHKVQLSS